MGRPRLEKKEGTTQYNLHLNADEMKMLRLLLDIKNLEDGVKTNKTTGTEAVSFAITEVIKLLKNKNL